MMLRPQDTATRDTKCLSGMWDFAFDAGGPRPDREMVHSTVAHVHRDGSSGVVPGSLH